MAKGHVTTDDLATGMKAFGGLSSLGGAPRPVRDNPFRDTRAEPVPPAVVPTAPEPESPRLEVINGHDKAGVGEGSKKPLAPRPSRDRKPAVPRTAERIERPAQPNAAEHSANGREKKTEVYTERVTVLLNAELRDGAEALAKELQRRRTQKGERITTNTVIRVALRAMLETFQPSADLDLNTEGELYEAALNRGSR